MVLGTWQVAGTGVKNQVSILKPGFERGPTRKQNQVSESKPGSAKAFVSNAKPGF